MIEAKTNTPPAAPATGKLSDSEFLRREADEAKAAATRSLEQAKAALTKAIDPRQVTRAHPLIAVGSAAIAGFIAALVAIPSKEQQALRRMEKLHRAMHPEPAPVKESNGSPKPPAPSIWAMIAKESIAVLKPILIAAVTSGLNVQSTPPPAPPGDPSNVNPPT